MRGKALVDQGDGQTGIQLLRQGLAAFNATGAEMGKTMFLALLAEACRDTGQYASGLATIAVAGEFALRSQEAAILPELHRLEGELLLRADAGATSVAEACFYTALEHARRQGAKSWELRAATSLARLWQREGRADDARALLAPVHAWFTEGHETLDLLTARAARRTRRPSRASQKPNPVPCRSRLESKALNGCAAPLQVRARRNPQSRQSGTSLPFQLRLARSNSASKRSNWILPSDWMLPAPTVFQRPWATDS